MSDDKPTPSSQKPPLAYEFEQALSRLSHVVRAHTNAIRLVDAKEVANAKMLGEALHLLSSLRLESGAAADRVVDKVELVLEMARDARADLRQALGDLRAANDRLGNQRDDLAALKLADRFTPTSVPVLSREAEEEQEAQLPDGISVRHGRIEARIGIVAVGKAIKRHSGWLTTGVIAAWHFAGDHIVGAARAAWHFLGH